MTRAAIVLAGGDPVEAALAKRLPSDAFVVAADSGLHNAVVLGLRVDLVVGDFDSVDATELADAEAHGTAVERHPAEKDATDLELALVAAADCGATRVTVVGGAGGRLDHFFANAALLTSQRFAALTIEAFVGDAKLTVVRGGNGEYALRGTSGELVTLLPYGGDAHAVTTTGLQYPLHAEDLPAGTSRGVSNVFLATSATVALERGTLLVVQPYGGTP